MKLSEEQILKEVIRLFSNLEDATYGKERTNGHSIHPDTGNFYVHAKRLYELTDELVADYRPDYVTLSDYQLILDSKRELLLELNVQKGKKRRSKQELTYLIEPYIMKLQGLFGKILSVANSMQHYCNKYP